jgi:TPR repeat protein
MSFPCTYAHATHLRTNVAAIAVCAMLAVLPGQLVAEGANKPDPFNAAVKAVKSENYSHAYDLFETLAQNDNHDAQFNLAVLLKKGQGRPQHFTKALEWALLAQLGGVPQANALRQDLSALVTPNSYETCIANVDAILKEKLAQGNRRTILQYVVFNQTIVPEPDLETAYLWALIGAALGIPNADLLRDSMVEELDPDTIESAQENAKTLFEEQKMATLFSSSAG